METIEVLVRCFEIPYKALFEEAAEAETNYAQVLFALEDALKERLNADVAECIKNARTDL